MIKYISILIIGFLYSIPCNATPESAFPVKNQIKITETTPVTDTLFYKMKRATNKENEVLLVLLHGYGSNENDLLGLARFFPKNYTIISARAPFTLRNGAYQWYQSTSKGTNFGGKASDLSTSQELIQKLVQKTQQQFHINADHTFISGFSQGANMSYQMGLLYPKLCKGIGVFSGVLFNSEKEKVIKENNIAVAIFIGHGTADNRIPESSATASNTWLTAHNFQTDFHTYEGMSHSISPKEMQDFIQFVSRNISN
ncbi:alpha/beta hydrolase [Neptunitalea lumnitzerae]|uniref:Phospholipase/carboxylesterase n=1 Tax=Neptunitalea lumnitzerae TaxID=2965509 RepID=A0ABQ5MIN3_9FLAO|nr:dienelactone hydrolase family protein [Neptunitalea sp. Y10]GLB49276.1 phospholipase/carboxylesterase [Neptunitalea sp. Y10]